MWRYPLNGTSSYRRVFLWGMPGAGKTTGGKRIADRLGWPWIDLDAALEQEAGMPIKEIFRLRGEAGFRDLEAEVLHKFLNSGASFIMSTGGGTPCFHGLDEAMNRSGLTVFLDCLPEELVHRLTGDLDRPLLCAEDEDRARWIMELLLLRRPVYERAQRIVHVTAGIDWELTLAGVIVQWSTHLPEEMG